MNTCKKWDYNFGNNVGNSPLFNLMCPNSLKLQATIEWGNVYLPPITKRLNKLLPGVGLSRYDVHGALYACAYDLAAHGVSPWCGAFSQSEINDFEYELDLLMDGAFGYNLPGTMEKTLGSVFVNTLVKRLTDANGQKVYLEFGHDTTIDLALSALGLALYVFSYFFQSMSLDPDTYCCKGTNPLFPPKAPLTPTVNGAPPFKFPSLPK